MDESMLVELADVAFAQDHPIIQKALQIQDVTSCLSLPIYKLISNIIEMIINISIYKNFQNKKHSKLIRNLLKFLH